VPKPFDKRTVHHLWRVQAMFPRAPFPRTMLLVRLGDRQLLTSRAITV
jgi:hypothetical protein